MSADPLVLSRISALSLASSSSTHLSRKLPKPIPEGRCARTGCRNQATPGFKSCEPCRTKGREDQRKYNARREAARRAALGLFPMVDGTMEAIKRKAEEPVAGPSKKLKEDEPLSGIAPSSKPRKQKKLKHSSNFMFISVDTHGKSNIPSSPMVPAVSSSPATSSPPPLNISATSATVSGTRVLPLGDQRRCTKCKRAVLPPEHRFKYCDPCRQKNTEESRKYQQRKRERDLEMARIPGVHPGFGLDLDSQDYSLSTLRGLQPTPPPVEFQTAGDLYAALKRMSKRVKPGKHVTFSGRFQLVTTETEKYDSRALAVFRDLKRRAKLLTGDVVMHTTTTDRVKLTRACLCGRGSDGDQGCRGVVEVVCEYDESHIFLPGVNITVRVGKKL